MKSIFKFVCVAIAVMAAASCAKEIAPEQQEAETNESGKLVPITFAADLESCKATFDGTKVCWESSDEIAIFDGTARQKFTVASCDGTSAVFTGSVTEGAEVFYAVYPYDAATSEKDGVITVNIPAEQTIASGKNVDDKALVMVAKADAGALAFKNCVALAKVNVAVDGISSVSFAGNNSEKISGAATTAEDGVVKCSGGTAATISAADGTLAKGDYYIALAPASLTKGITVTCGEAVGGKIFKSSAKSVTFARSSGLNLKTVTDGDEVANPIMTKAQLKAWAKWNAGYAASETVKLGADINLDGENWTPVDNFVCTFDGQNHKIYGFKVSGGAAYFGFFGYAKGDVKNLVFGSADGETYDGVSTISFDYTGSSADWFYVAAIARTSKNVTNVTSFVPVTVASTSVAKCRLAGIVGCAAGENTTIQNCVNRANVTNNTAAATREQLMGGVMAVIDNTVTVKNCSNYGEVKSTASAYTTCLGGIASNISSGKKGTITGCHNYGNVANVSTVTSPAETANESRVGGIIGYANGGSAGYVINITDCHNHANLTNSAPLLIMYGGIAGRATMCNISSCTNEGTIKFNGANVATKALGIGGIVGQTYTCKVDKCSNSGEIWTNKKQVNRAGGIIGTSAGSLANYENTISNCTNSGNVTVNQTKSSSSWESAGGIVGFQENITCPNNVKGCTNTGNINATFFSTQAAGRVAAGGIVGSSKAGTEISGNINSGKVTGVNSASGPMQAGGIIGHDDYKDKDTDADNTVAIKNNKNFGDVSSSVAGGTAYSAGGIIGRHTRTPNISGNISKCTVSCANYAGAVVGWNISANITGAQVAGKVGTTALTADNVSSLAAGKIDAGTVSGVTLYTE